MRKYAIEFSTARRPFHNSQIHVTFDPAGSYAVDGLKPDTLYRFSLAARSEMGLGVYTQAIEARTAQSSKSLILIWFYLPPPAPAANQIKNRAASRPRSSLLTRKVELPKWQTAWVTQMSKSISAQHQMLPAHSPSLSQTLTLSAHRRAALCCSTSKVGLMCPLPRIIRIHFLRLLPCMCCMNSLDVFLSDRLTRSQCVRLHERERKT